MIEAVIEQYLVDTLKPWGARCDKVVDLSRVGGPDREVQWGLSFLPPTGEPLGADKVELKRPNGEPRKTQVRYHEYLALCGTPVYLIDTKERVDMYIAARLRGEHLPQLFSVPVHKIR